MQYIVNGVTKEVNLRVWSGSSYSPDFFADMELSGYDPEDADGNRIVSSERYKEICDYWADEVAIANAGDFSEQFGNWRKYHPEPEELAFRADI